VTGRQIVAFERAPEVTSLDTNDRIRLRVERLAAAEHFNCDRIGLDAVAAPRQSFLYHVGKEAALTPGCIEVRARHDQQKLRTAILSRKIISSYREGFSVINQIPPA
jgi:hypothetical protein